MEGSIADYLNSEFVFEDTQLVQSSSDIGNKVISVSLVGTPISDEVIALLEQELPGYNLEGYTLHVTQNQSVEGADNNKITIALQESAINELQAQLEEAQGSINELESRLETQVDCKKISEDARVIFPKLTECNCGVMSGTDGEFLFFTGTAPDGMTEEEEQILRNWLGAESQMAQIELQISGL